MSWLERWAATWLRLVEGDGGRLLWVLGAYVALTFVERARPAEPGQGLRGRWRNVGFGALYVLLGHATLAAWFATSPLSLERRESGGPWTTLMLCLGYLFLADVFYYWYHRAQHRFGWLWVLHELHHSDAELNVTTSFRISFLEIPVQLAVTLVPTLFLLRGEAHALMLFLVINTALVLFAHLNVRLPLGPLTPVLCGPQLHRIHHSRRPAHRDRNFAMVFPVIDVLFGTYLAPRRDEHPPTGADTLRPDVGLFAGQLRPLLAWPRLLRAALAPAASRPGARRTSR